MEPNAMSKKAATKIWWDLVCDLKPDTYPGAVLAKNFMPDSLYNQYKKVRDTKPNTVVFSAMTKNEIFMAMCFLSYIYDPKE